MYSYFISFYMSLYPDGFQFLNMNYRLNEPISCYDDILSITESIKNHHEAHAVVILYYVQLGGANVQASPFQMVHPTSNKDD